MAAKKFEIVSILNKKAGQDDVEENKKRKEIIAQRAQHAKERTTYNQTMQPAAAQIPTASVDHEKKCD